MADAWEWLNWMASVGFTVALVPQLRRTLTLRRADDVSRRFLGLVILSSSMMLVYCLHTGNLVFAAAQAVNIAAWAVVLWFRMHPGKPRMDAA